jgi:hypothetical protein
MGTTLAQKINKLQVDLNIIHFSLKSSGLQRATIHSASFCGMGMNRFAGASLPASVCPTAVVKPHPFHLRWYLDYYQRLTPSARLPIISTNPLNCL